MLAVIDEYPGLWVPKRADPASQCLVGLKQGYLNAFLDEFARAGNARNSASYDCNSGRYDLPPVSFDLTIARAAMATLRLLGTEMRCWKTS